MKSPKVVVVIALLTLGLVFTTVLLFYANRVPALTDKAAQNKSAPGAQTLLPFVSNAVMSLKGDEKKSWELISSKIESAGGAEKISWIDSAIIFWDMRNRPDIASDFATKKAKTDKTAKSFVYAGQRNYYAVRFVEDPAEQQALYNAAIKNLQQALSIEPGNTDAKIDLAACYVEGSADPMKGIAMLREVERVDSNNIKLQLNFGFFSAKSGQWDKAEMRFRKALKIDSTYIETWLNLADVYEQQGELQKSIEALQIFASKTDDAMAKSAISEYIAQLRKKLKEEKRK